jgi:hypothetical protein
VATVERLQRETLVAVPLLLGVLLALAWRSCLKPEAAAGGIAAAGGAGASAWAASLEARRRDMARRLGSVVGADADTVAASAGSAGGAPFATYGDMLISEGEGAPGVCGVLASAAALPLPVVFLLLVAVRVALSYATSFAVARISGSSAPKPAAPVRAPAPAARPTAASAAGRGGPTGADDDLLAAGLGGGGGGEDALARAMQAMMAGGGGGGAGGGPSGAIGWVLRNGAKALTGYRAAASGVGDCASFIFAYVLTAALAGAVTH